MGTAIAMLQVAAVMVMAMVVPTPIPVAMIAKARAPIAAAAPAQASCAPQGRGAGRQLAPRMLRCRPAARWVDAAQAQAQARSRAQPLTSPAASVSASASAGRQAPELASVSALSLPGAFPRQAAWLLAAALALALVAPRLVWLLRLQVRRKRAPPTPMLVLVLPALVQMVVLAPLPRLPVGSLR
jgi:hypothetical protein